MLDNDFDAAELDRGYRDGEAASHLYERNHLRHCSREYRAGFAAGCGMHHGRGLWAHQVAAISDQARVFNADIELVLAALGDDDDFRSEVRRSYELVDEG
jgi:hypothetical protein